MMVGYKATPSAAAREAVIAVATATQVVVNRSPPPPHLNAVNLG